MYIIYFIQLIIIKTKKNNNNILFVNRLDGKCEIFENYRGTQNKKG